MNYKIVYDIDYTGLYEIIALVEQKFRDGLEEEGSATIQAIKESTFLVLDAWIKKAESKFTHNNGEYVAGFEGGLLYPFQGDPLYARIANRWQKAVYFENGWEPFDMKKALQTSEKVRISKDGKRYLIIPFEHGTPGTTTKRAMPQEIYSEAKRLKPSIISNKFNEGSVRQAVTQADAELLKKYNPTRVQRNSYEWGDKLTHIKRAELEDGSIYKGMVRFQTNPNIVRDMVGASKFGFKNQTDNMRSHSLYTTFRVMSEDSQGWMHPGLKAMNIRGETFDETKNEVLQKISNGVKKDYLRVLPNAT